MTCYHQHTFWNKRCEATGRGGDIWIMMNSIRVNFLLFKRTLTRILSVPEFGWCYSKYGLQSLHRQQVFSGMHMRCSVAVRNNRSCASFISVKKAKQQNIQHLEKHIEQIRWCNIYSIIARTHSGQSLKLLQYLPDSAANVETPWQECKEHAILVWFLVFQVYTMFFLA